VFSSPDAEPDVIPAFVGKGGKPVQLDRPPRLPGFEQTRLLNDLTADQKKRISQLQSDTNERVRAVQEHLAVVQKKLDVAKAHPNETLTIQGASLPKPSELKAEIAELRKSIEQKRREANEELSKILTQAQRDQIENMMRGQLILDAVPPLPEEEMNEDAAPPRRTIFGARKRKQQR
jgi:hypothetical protein